VSLTFGVYGLAKPEVIEKLGSLLDHQVVEEIYFEHSLAKQMGVESYTLNEMKDHDIDFVISIGGDGTLLKLMQEVDVPAFGVNTGTVGFLTTSEIEGLKRALERIDEGDYFLDHRMKVDVFLNGDKKGECVNEVVVHSDKIAKLRKIEVLHDGVEIDRFRGDGVIIATPTGSTSYALSAGGPIINPGIDVLMSVPIASFDLDAKPHVLPADGPVEIELLDEEKTCLMVMDGQKECIVDHDDLIEVEKSDKTARFIRFEDDFYSKVKKKLVKR